MVLQNSLSFHDYQSILLELCERIRASERLCYAVLTPRSCLTPALLSAHAPGAACLNVVLMSVSLAGLTLHPTSELRRLTGSCWNLILPWCCGHYPSSSRLPGLLFHCSLHFLENVTLPTRSSSLPKGCGAQLKPPFFVPSSAALPLSSLHGSSVSQS